MTCNYTWSFIFRSIYTLGAFLTIEELFIVGNLCKNIINRKYVYPVINIDYLANHKSDAIGNRFPKSISKFMQMLNTNF